MPSQHPSVRSPVLVTKTDQVRQIEMHVYLCTTVHSDHPPPPQGQLDYLTYPHRLLITNLVPNIVNAVMLLEITSFEQNSESRDQCWDVLIHAKDPTGNLKTGKYR